MDIEQLGEWLDAQGFRREPEFVRAGAAGWYAWRKTTLKARECACNEGKSQQLIVTPFRWRGGADVPGFESVEVAVTGEYQDVWFKVLAYSLKPLQLHDHLPAIEQSLIGAWNALSGQRMESPSPESAVHDSLEASQVAPARDESELIFDSQRQGFADGESLAHAVADRETT